MSTDEYAWTDEQARKFTAPCVDRWQWDAWLAAHDARVKRDAAREALDGLADVHRRHASESDQAAASDVHSIVASQALHYRDTHYPETED